MRMANLMELADQSIQTSQILVNNKLISESYYNMVSGFGITVATNGLLPAIVIYCQDRNQTRNINRKIILEIIARMIHDDNLFSMNNTHLNITNADSLLDAVKAHPLNRDLKMEVLDCAIALKQIIRTYEAEKQ